jgi:hypothetical protein
VPALCVANGHLEVSQFTVDVVNMLLDRPGCVRVLCGARILYMRYEKHDKLLRGYNIVIEVSISYTRLKEKGPVLCPKQGCFPCQYHNNL